MIYKHDDKKEVKDKKINKKVLMLLLIIYMIIGVISYIISILTKSVTLLYAVFISEGLIMLIAFILSISIWFKKQNKG